MPIELPLEVESTFSAGDRAYVLARRLHAACDFVLTAAAALDAHAIERWIDVPRAHDAEGKDRTDLFAFCLKNAAERAYFIAGRRITLTGVELAPSEGAV